MASYCMLCSKKLGFLSSFGEDVLTGNTANKICENCLNKTDVIFKKIEMKIPFTPEDFEGFSEEGQRYIDTYLETFGIKYPLGDEDGDAEKKNDIMNLEIGDATVEHSFDVDPEETEEIFEKFKDMTDSEIEDFLEGIVSEGDTADGFINEIISLNNEELAAVISEQREYYNNAEWAYIMLVDYRRRMLEETEKKDEISESEEIPEKINQAEVERMRDKYSALSAEELEEIISDRSYTYEARTAAEELLSDKKD